MIEVVCEGRRFGDRTNENARDWLWVVLVAWAAKSVSLFAGQDLGSDSTFLPHGRNHGDHEFITRFKLRLDFLADVVFRNTQVLSDVSVVAHQGHVAFIDVNQLVVYPLNGGNIHVVGGGAHIFILLVGEDVDTNQVNLSMSVFAGLGGGHLYNFAGTSLQHHIAVLTQSRALHRVGGGGARLASREVKIGICHGAMGQGCCRRHSQINNLNIKH